MALIMPLVVATAEAVAVLVEAQVGKVVMGEPLEVQAEAVVLVGQLLAQGV